jgi:hypothetical protein
MDAELQPESDEPLLVFLAGLTPAEHVQVKEEALALIRRLLDTIALHSLEHPDISGMVWLLAIYSLSEASQSMATELG